MKCLPLISLLFFAAYCPAQNVCNPIALSQFAPQVLTIQNEIEQTKVDEMDDGVPSALADKMIQLKDSLSRISDAALACAKPSVDSSELQKDIANALHANAPEPPANTSISKDDHRYDEIIGSYGHNLRVKVNRSVNSPGILVIQYSINIECGNDNMLLVYELHDGAWAQKLRWQSPPLRMISDAFGDFFLSALVHDSTALDSTNSKWSIVVAHGTPWCTSRMSGFKIDLLSPGPSPASPNLIWHTEREYSRGDFGPTIKSSGNTFELRLNADCMSFDGFRGFERRVIYRYTVDGNDQVHRLGPIALNARGFVEEWLSAPWSESRDLSAAEAASALQQVHDQFDPPLKPNSDHYFSHSLGPVKACSTPAVYQVQIDSTLEKIVIGKPGGDSEPLASHYFHVREVKDGYLMLSAPTEPDKACSGADLMPAVNQ